MGATTLSAQVENEELQEQFEQWKDERGFDSRSEAIRAAIRTAVIDEHSEPRRDKSAMQGVASGLIALVSIIIGQTWLMYGIQQAAVMFALTLFVFGLVHGWRKGGM